jgi:hypothetical protein
MSNLRSEQRAAVAESVFERQMKREAEIADALTQEAARHAAVIANMHRLRALRLARNEELRSGSGRGSKLGA